MVIFNQLTSKKHAFLGLVLASLASTSFAITPKQVKTVVEAQQESYLSTLKDLVHIESGSKDIEGLDQIAKLIAERLKATGADVNIIQNKDIYPMNDAPEQVGPAIKATIKGKGKGNIMLLAHMDTVYPRGLLKDQPFRVDGNRAYGLGITDDKQGIALIIHTLETLKTLNYQDFGTITVLINSDEEISSPGSRKLITETAKGQDVVLSFETDGEAKDGSLRLATSGIGAAYLTVQGKSSHAGMNPEGGVNALTELSHQILQMKDLSKPETGLKMNWTIANAGKTRNVIPDSAVAQADVRALKQADFNYIDKTLHEKIKNKLLEDSQIDVKFEVRRPPLEVSEKAIKLASTAQNIYKNELNLPLTILTTPMGGGTDAAFAGLESQAATIEGMGLTGTGAHSVNAEYVFIDSIVPRLYLTTRLIMETAKK